MAMIAVRQTPGASRSFSGTQEKTGCRIKSGVTRMATFVAQRIACSGMEMAVWG
jgi:hypothetical protein